MPHDKDTAHFTSPVISRSRDIRKTRGRIDPTIRARGVQTAIDDDIPFPELPAPGGGGGATLTFAQTEAGQRLASALALDTERFAGAERLRLEDTLHALAVDLLPPKDVETAMRQVRKGEVVKSKLAFQAVLQNLADEAAIAERRKDIALAEEHERQTLRNARARITVDMIGRDLGRAVLYALGTGGE